MRRVALLLVLAACNSGSKDTPKAPAKGSGSGSAAPTARHNVQQIDPPDDLKQPSADATKTADGLVYRTLLPNATGQQPHRNDTVLLNYTGWKQATGETFFTSRTRAQPNSLRLTTTAPGFSEAVLAMHKGEKLRAWIPPSLATGGTPNSKADTLVYDFELLDITAAPATPTDVAGPPATAQKLAGVDVPYVVAKPGTGKDKPRAWDTVTFQLSGWEASGRMFDTTEMRKHGAVAPPFKESDVLQTVLTSMTTGERVRFWVDADRMKLDGRPPPGLPKGALCYEVELVDVKKAAAEPPPAPSDVAAPPADAKKTGKGVFYKVLEAGPAGGAHPRVTDVVKLVYTGWHTDGRMFESTVIKGEPQPINVSAMVGWTELLPQLVPGDHVRAWIPEELANKGAPGKAQGMLVLDIKLVEIKAPQIQMQPKKP